MTVAPRDWQQISSLSGGELQDFPYPLLLAALSATKATVVLAMEHKPVEKRITVIDGSPVDCRSNLAHETFGRFLLASGKLTDEDFHECLSESLTSGMQLGETLAHRQLLTPQEVFRLLQQNLARKLLDGFTWSKGSFRLESDVPATDGSIKVNVPQLVLTGVLKLSSLDEIGREMKPYTATRLALHPNPGVTASSLKGRPAVAKVVDSLDNGSQLMDELSASADLAPDELWRILYALTVLEVVVPEKRAAALSADGPRAPAPSVRSEAPDPTPPETSEEDRLLWTSRIFAAYLAYRRKDAFELLELPEDADLGQTESAYLDWAQSFAPWELEARGLTEHRDKGRDLFLAAARAYAELTDPDRRAALLEKRRSAATAAETQPVRHAIETDLLDPEVQHRKGLQMLEKGEVRQAAEYLRFAADCDPQNATFRSEAAYAQYLIDPRIFAEDAIEELEAALRVDGNCGLALYYMGLVQGESGELTVAEEYLRRAIKPMTPDRRPIEALRELKKSGKRRR